MLTLLAMRREEDEPRRCEQSVTGESHARTDDSATGGEEFVDILQVQQLLLDGNHGTGTGTGAGTGNGANQLGTTGGGVSSRGRGRELPLPPDYHHHHHHHRDRSADAGPLQYHYAGSHHHYPTSAVDDLVALWFTGSNTAV